MFGRFIDRNLHIQSSLAPLPENCYLLKILTATGILSLLQDLRKFATDLGKRASLAAPDRRPDTGANWSESQESGRNRTM